MARILAEGTGAESASVWVRVAGELHRDAGWPSDGAEVTTLGLDDGEAPSVPGATLSLPVHHRGELLGALALTKPAGERLTPTEEKLAADPASQAGLVLRNVRLTEELLDRLRELQASRQRIVAAQDQERRRLERNIHDGAQQQLVALAVRVRLARQLTERDPAKADSMLDEVEQQLATALEDLRDLARGIYPPLLADQGLPAALGAQARKAALPVEVETDGLGRYPQDVEAAVYFCSLEALQNVAKYANASKACIRVWEGDRSPFFSVSDDGRGFDAAAISHGSGLQGMGDRLSALGGNLEVTSRPGDGTAVVGCIPLS
jgi:signal transduction histidine kinase